MKKELHIGERVNFENGGQETEYDSDSDKEVSDSTEVEVEANHELDGKQLTFVKIYSHSLW